MTTKNDEALKVTNEKLRSLIELRVAALFELQRLITAELGHLDLAAPNAPFEVDALVKLEAVFGDMSRHTDNLTALGRAYVAVGGECE